MEELDTKQDMEHAQEPESVKSKGLAMVALEYGVLTAIALIVLTLIIYFADLQAARWVSWIGYGILLAGLFIGTKAFRDEFNGGFINYGRALGFGTLSMFFAALISSVFVYVFYKFIAPDAMGPLREAAEEQILRTNPNISDQEYDMAMRFISPGIIAFTSVFSYTFIGFVLALITSAFLKRKDPLEA